MTQTHIVMKLNVPDEVAAEGPEAIDDWLNELEFTVLDPSADSEDPAPVEIEIVENQFDFATGL